MLNKYLIPKETLLSSTFKVQDIHRKAHILTYFKRFTWQLHVADASFLVQKIFNTMLTDLVDDVDLELVQRLFDYICHHSFYLHKGAKQL